MFSITTYGRTEFTWRNYRVFSSLMRFTAIMSMIWHLSNIIHVYLLIFIVDHFSIILSIYLIILETMNEILHFDFDILSIFFSALLIRFLILLTYIFTRKRYSHLIISIVVLHAQYSIWLVIRIVVLNIYCLKKLLSKSFENIFSKIVLRDFSAVFENFTNTEKSFKYQIFKNLCTENFNI